MNAVHSSSKTSSFKTVHECLDYVIDELDRFESLPIHVIHLYLSAAKPEIQKKVALTDSDLLQLLKSCPDSFEINDMLEVTNSKYHKERNSDRFVDRSGTLLPQKIENGRGSISRLFAAYGFIKVTYPFQTCVYFSSRLFNDSYKLLSLDLSQFRVNELVGFDAEFGKGNNDTPYRATGVWKVYEEDDEEEEEDRYSCDSRRSKASSRSQNSTRSKKNYPKAKKGSQTSLSNQNLAEDKIFYSRNEMKTKPQVKSNDTQPKLTSKPPNYKKKVRHPVKIKAEGIVNNLFVNYGFITSRENKSDKVFFALNVCKLLKNTSNLAKTYKIGDIVKFTAVPSSKKGSKVMWEATSVVLKADYVDSASSSDETSSEEIVVPAQEKQKKASIKEIPKETPNSFSLSKSNNSLKNCQGKIYPLSDTTAIIKFGPQFLENANAETCEFYLGGERIIDVRWEFHDGDFVYFDATRSTGSQWDASLVWQGDKPDFPEIGSETEDEICQEQQSCELEPSLPTAEFASNVPNTSINWGDTPYPGEDMIDECSPRDSESYYSSTESHLSTDGATTTKNKRQDGERETMSSNNLNEYSNDTGGFLEKNHLNIKENIVENSNDCKIVNKKNNQNQGSKYLSNKNSETYNYDNDSNILKDEACNNAYSESSKFLSSMKQNEFSDIENFINIKSDKKSKTVSKQNLTESEAKKTNKIDNEPGSKSKSSKPEATAKTLPKPASISMFENVKGKITKIYRIHIDVCLESDKDKHIALIWNDLYYEGVLIREKCKDLKELLKLQDELLLNFFEITDDHSLAFRKVTLAWIGQKPQDIKEMEPREFIQTQNLEVSCKIPSRKDFFKTFSKNQTTFNSENLSKTQLKGSAEGSDESMGHLNQSTTEISDGATGARKKSFLSTSFASSNGSTNRDSVDTDAHTRHIPLKVREFMTPADVSGILFSRVQQIKQTVHNPTMCLQVIGQLERDLKSAVAILQPQLTLSNSPEIQTSSADRGCQTTESMLVPLDNKIMHSSETCAKTRQVSTAMQTIITGDIIAASVFPH